MTNILYLDWFLLSKLFLKRVFSSLLLHEYDVSQHCGVNQFLTNPIQPPVCKLELRGCALKSSFSFHISFHSNYRCQSQLPVHANVKHFQLKELLKLWWRKSSKISPHSRCQCIPAGSCRTCLCHPDAPHTALHLHKGCCHRRLLLSGTVYQRNPANTHTESPAHGTHRLAVLKENCLNVKETSHPGGAWEVNHFLPYSVLHSDTSPGSYCSLLNRWYKK